MGFLSRPQARRLRRPRAAVVPAEIVWEDQFGEVIDRASADVIEIRWYDTTSAMSSDEFNEWLVRFADSVEERRRAGVLVDSLSFLMDPSNMNGPWRDANIIPRYNAAGVRRFAFLMPAGMPLIGQEPAREGPGEFPTGYFGTRESAMDWLGD